MPFFANEETRTNGKPKSWFVLCRIKLFALSFNAYDRITLATKNLYYPTLEVINTSLRKRSFLQTEKLKTAMQFVPLENMRQETCADS